MNAVPQEVLVVNSPEPMKVARAVVDGCFRGEDGLPTLYEYLGGFWEWYGGRKWVKRDQAWLFDTLACILEDAEIRGVDVAGIQTVERFKPTVEKVRGVARFVEALVRYPFETVPRFLVPRDGVDVEYLVPFDDVLVDVKQTAERFMKTGSYDWVTYPRDHTFFSSFSLPIKFDPEAVCPVYEKVASEWATGEEGFVEIRERFYGNMLIGTRKHRKFLLEHGSTFGGKSSMTRDVMLPLLGSPAYFGVQAQELTGDFGKDGMQESMLCVISEVEELGDSPIGRDLASLVKVAVGQDVTTVNIKGVRRIRDVQYKCGIVLQSNDNFVIPNSQLGVSSKLVPLHFRTSFIGKPDLKLADRLKEELAGIALRLVKAAVRLEADGKWDLPESSQKLLKKFERDANQFDAFLEDRFAKSKLWISNEVLRRARREWEQSTGDRLKTREGKWLKDQNLPALLCERSSWGLRQVRRTGSGAPVWGISGLSLLTKPKDVE